MSEAAAPGAAAGTAPTAHEVTAPSTTADAGQDAGQAPAPKKYKVKIDASEVEVDEAELINGYQMSAASRKRFEEAAQARKAVETFEKMWAENPKAVLLRAKNDPDFKAKFRAAAEEFLHEEYTQEDLSPEEKQRRDELKELEEWKAQRQQEQEEKARQAEEAKYEQETRQHLEAWQGACERLEVPLTTNVIRHAAFIQANEDITPQQAVVKATQAIAKETQMFASRLKGEKLISFLGEEVVQEIRRSDLERYRKSKGIRTPKEVVQGTVHQGADEGAPDPKVDYNKWLDHLAARIERQGR